MRGAATLLSRWQMAAGLSLVLAPVLAWPHVQPIPGHAHGPGVTYTSVGLHQGGVALLYTVPYEDAQRLSPELDSPRPEDLSNLIAAGLIVRDGDRPCELIQIDATDYAAIGSFQYKLKLACPDPEFMEFEYRLFNHPDHVNHVDVWLGPNNMALALDANLRSFEVPVAHVLWERGWTLPAVPPALTGEKPALIEYLYLGFDHVLSGFDHLAFVLGLVLLVSRFWHLAGLITSFTLAHSLTLGLAALDVFVLAQPITELVIALSIAYIGIENLWGLRKMRNKSGASAVVLDQAALRRRWFMSFGFGLVHGFGFSFLLREIGMPPGQLVPSLALFNIGVELAQLAAVVVPFIVLQRILRKTPAFTWLAALLSIGVTVAGFVWLYDRWV
jgi:hypothetical protein